MWRVRWMGRWRWRVVVSIVCLHLYIKSLHSIYTAYSKSLHSMKYRKRKWEYQNIHVLYICIFFNTKQTVGFSFSFLKSYSLLRNVYKLIKKRNLVYTIYLYIYYITILDNIISTYKVLKCWNTILKLEY